MKLLLWLILSPWWLFLVPAFYLAKYGWKLYWRLIWIESCLTLAERELNALILKGRDHGGRKNRVAERYEWNALDKWAPPFRLIGDVPARFADALVAENEKETQEHRRDMGRVKLTAFLLRQLFDASPDAAKAKIIAEFRNKGEIPYIAAGIYELLNLKDFRLYNWKGGVNWRELGYVVRSRGFPREIVMTRTHPNGEISEIRNRRVLETINAQVA